MNPARATTGVSKKTIILFLEDTAQADIIACAVRLIAQKGEINFYVVTSNRELEPFFDDCREHLLLEKQLATSNRSLIREKDLLRFSTLARTFNGILQTTEFQERFDKLEGDLFRQSSTIIALQMFFAEKQASVIKNFLEEQGIIDKIVIGLSPGEIPTGLSASAILRAARELHLNTYLMLPHEDTRGYKSPQFLDLFDKVFAIEASFGRETNSVKVINNRFINKIMHVLARRGGPRRLKRVLDRYLGSRLSQQFL